MTTPYCCPECGGKLFIDPEAETEITIAPAMHVRDRPLPTRRVRVPVAFCSACEFCLALDSQA